MFGRKSKIKKAIATSLRAALDGAGAAAFAPIEKLLAAEQVDAYVDLCHQLIYEEALEAADAAVDLALVQAPEELYVLDAKAEVAAEAGRFADALAIYQKMYEIAPGDLAVIGGLAELYLSNDDASAALALLESCPDLSEPALQLRLGEALYAADRATEALAILEQVHDYYEGSLKHASFVDDIEGIVASRDAARRLRDDVFAELRGREATIEKAARTGNLDE